MILATGNSQQGCQHLALRNGGPHSALLTHLVVMFGCKGSPRPDEEILFYSCANHMPNYVKADVEYERTTGTPLFRLFKLARPRLNLAQLREIHTLERYTRSIENPAHTFSDVCWPGAAQE